MSKSWASRKKFLAVQNPRFHEGLVALMGKILLELVVLPSFISLVSPATLSSLLKSHAILCQGGMCLPLTFGLAISIKEFKKKLDSI